MALVPSVDVDALPQDRKALLVRTNNLFAALANSPEGMAPYLALADWLRWECELDPRRRELAILAVGHELDSPWIVSHHIAIGAHFGVTEADADAVADRVGGVRDSLDAIDRAFVDAAGQLVRGRRLSDPTVAALGLDSGRLVDLTLLVGFYALAATVLGGLRIDNDAPGIAALRRHPMRSGRTDVG